MFSKEQRLEIQKEVNMFFKSKNHKFRKKINNCEIIIDECDLYIIYNKIFVLFGRRIFGKFFMTCNKTNPRVSKEKDVEDLDNFLYKCVKHYNALLELQKEEEKTLWS